MVWALRPAEAVNTHGFEDVAWQSDIFHFSSTKAIGTLTLQRFPTPVKSQLRVVSGDLPNPYTQYNQMVRNISGPEFLMNQRAFFTHFVLRNMIHWPKTFAIINKYCNNTLKVTSR